MWITYCNSAVRRIDLMENVTSVCRKKTPVDAKTDDPCLHGFPHRERKRRAAQCCCSSLWMHPELCLCTVESENRLACDIRKYDVVQS